jgi:two-component system, cell cycle sensor histidine kinase and response regulator CckA
MEMGTLHGTFLVSCVPIMDETGKIVRIVHMATDITSLKKTEKALKESEEKYRIHFENIFDVIYSLDREMRIIHVSPSVERALGYSPEELIGRVFTDLPILERESVGPALSNMVQMLAGERVAGAEYTFIARDGARRVGEVNGAPLRSKDGEIVGTVSVARDITQRKQAEETLEFTQFIVDGASESIHVIEPDGGFMYANNAMCESLGYSREELLSMKVSDIDPNYPLGEYHTFWKNIKKEKSLTFETAHRRKDGFTFPVEIRAKYMLLKGKDLVIAFGRDITERKQAEQKILDSERSLLAILSASPIGIGRTRDRVLSWVNETTCRITGYTSRELTGASPRLVYESDEEYERIGKALYSQEGQVEARIVRKDGEVRDVLIQVSPTDSYSYIFTLTDITRQKEAENALRFTQFAVDNARDLIMWIGEKGEILYANDSVCKATGYGREELFSMNILEIDSCLTPGSWEERWIRRKALGALSVESYTRRKDGSLFPVEISSSYVEYNDKGYACAIIRDITGRKETEAALQESETKYRSVVENSLVGFYIVQDGLFRFVNKRFCEIFGYSYDETVDRLDPVVLAHPEDREKVKENLRKRIEGETDFIEYAFKTLRKDGGVITVKVIGTSISYNGRPAATGSLMDITREETLESQLRQAQKMEALGTLAGGIAHDFNNILTVISGYGSLLTMTIDEANPLRMYVDPILASSERAANLTQSLLAFSRRQPITLIPISINASIRKTEKLLRRLLTEDVELVVSLSPEEITVMADPTQIEQILFNLATNARDAMQKGGRLTIETTRVEVDQEFVTIHGCGEPGSYALLAVSDTGSGMNEATKEKIFDPFFTTKETGKGTGLGLSTVYGIVQQHNGHIAVYSEEGMGAAFHIYFRAVKKAVREEKAAFREVKGGNETILVAEDNEDVRRFLKSLLSKYGYAVVEAVDGEDALNKFKGHGKIDLMVLDSVMPKKNGRETYDEIHEIDPGARVIFMSGYTRDVVLDKGVEARKFDFVSKPIMPDEILVKIRKVLDREPSG